VFLFVGQYVLPVTTFAYCYGHIFYTIRRQNKTVAGHVGRNSQDVRTATTSRDQTTGQIQQQVTEATAGANKLSRTEMNVLQTMILVMVCFILCWTPASLKSFIDIMLKVRIFYVYTTSNTAMFLLLFINISCLSI